MKIRIHVYYQRAGQGIRQILHRTELQTGDQIHMVAVGIGKMVLIREDREVLGVRPFRVLRCWKLHLDPKMEKGKRIGTDLHRVCEAVTRDMGLVFCTADDDTVAGNEVTTAMRARLLELYPDHLKVGNATLLLGDRLTDEAAQLRRDGMTHLVHPGPPKVIPETAEADADTAPAPVPSDKAPFDGADEPA